MSATASPRPPQGSNQEGRGDSTAARGDVLLSVRDLTKHFPIKKGLFGKQVGTVRAVDGVSFDILRGETLGVVGESGCGKTTAGRCILRLIEPTGGEVRFGGVDVLGLGGGDLRRIRRRSSRPISVSSLPMNCTLPPVGFRSWRMQ